MQGMSVTLEIFPKVHGLENWAFKDELGVGE